MPQNSSEGLRVTPRDHLPALGACEGLAVGLLVIGCLSGLAALLWREASKPAAAPIPSASRQELMQRVRELEARLLEQVPRSIEHNYSDH